MRPSIPLVSAIAFLAVSAGMSIGFWSGLSLMSLGLVAAVVALALGRESEDAARPARSASAARTLLAIALLVFCAWHVLLPPGIYLRPPHPLAFRVLAAVALVCAATYLFPAPGSIARWRFLAVVALFVAMGIVTILASPEPFIDVWWYQQWAGKLLWQGYNPYSFDFPNIYPDTRLFGADAIRGGKLSAYPYPPLTFLVGAPVVQILGDVRFLLLALMAAAALIARRWEGSDAAELPALALLFQPNAFYVLEQAWTEPFVGAAFALAVLAVLRRPRAPRGWIWAGVAGGLLVATKQYVLPLAVPLVLALPRGVRVRATALAAAAAAATMLPFVVSDPAEFWHDVVALQLSQPFRTDSLSWLVPIARALGRPVSAAWGFVAAGIVLAGWLRPGISVPQAVRIAAATMLALVLFNKQSFANYYWLCTALLAFACVLSAREARAASA